METINADGPEKTEFSDYPKKRDFEHVLSRDESLELVHDAKNLNELLGVIPKLNLFDTKSKQSIANIKEIEGLLGTGTLDEVQATDLAQKLMGVTRDFEIRQVVERIIVGSLEPDEIALFKVAIQAHIEKGREDAQRQPENDMLVAQLAEATRLRQQAEMDALAKARAAAGLDADESSRGVGRWSRGQ